MIFLSSLKRILLYVFYGFINHENPEVAGLIYLYTCMGVDLIRRFSYVTYKYTMTYWELRRYEKWVLSRTMSLVLNNLCNIRPLRLVFFVYYIIVGKKCKLCHFTSFNCNIVWLMLLVCHFAPQFPTSLRNIAIFPFKYFILVLSHRINHRAI